jgi:putative transposase
MRYRRLNIAGGTYFFTVNLLDRHSTLLVDRIEQLRAAVRIVKTRHPFEIVAWVTLPDHLHAIWQLPQDDVEFARRWRLIKAAFSRSLPGIERIDTSRLRKGERGIWQRRYWEHLIRDDDDLQRHIDYVHINPVKHGHVRRASDWPYSSVHRYIGRGQFKVDWASADPRRIRCRRTVRFGGALVCALLIPTYAETIGHARLTNRLRRSGRGRAACRRCRWSRASACGRRCPDTTRRAGCRCT